MSEPTDTNDYTKDEWIAQLETSHRFMICQMSDEEGSTGGSIVEGCEVVIDVPEEQARRIANLMAAAPDLYRALQKTLDHLQTAWPNEGMRLRHLRDAVYTAKWALRWAEHGADHVVFDMANEFEDDRLCAEIENVEREAASAPR